MSEKRPLNGFFVCIYYLVNLVAGILHPVTIIGRENLPEHGALLCPNHNSNWDPVLVALKVPVNYRQVSDFNHRGSFSRGISFEDR